MITRGAYQDPSGPPSGEPRLHLYISAKTQESLDKAVDMVKTVLVAGRLHLYNGPSLNPKSGKLVCFLLHVSLSLSLSLFPSLAHV